MSGTKCPVSGTNQLVPDKMSGTLGYLFSGLVVALSVVVSLCNRLEQHKTSQ